MKKWNHVAEYMKDYRKNHPNHKIVITCGCYDILHVGHIISLKESKKFGDMLIVALNSDKSVKSIKGPKRPIYPEKDRIEILESLKFVDKVFLFDEDTPEEIIRVIKPDVFAKGEDYRNFELPAQSFIEDYGGEIGYTPLVNKNIISTTEIIERIKEI